MPEDFSSLLFESRCHLWVLVGVVLIAGVEPVDGQMLYPNWQSSSPLTTAAADDELIAPPLQQLSSGRQSRCQPPMPPRNVNARVRQRGMVAYFRCSIRNQQLFGRAVAVCVNQTWSHSPPVCVAPGCPMVSVRQPTLLKKFTVPEYQGAVLTFSCAPGYVIQGASSLTCNGRLWSSSPPSCRPLPTSVLIDELPTTFEPDNQVATTSLSIRSKITTTVDSAHDAAPTGSEQLCCVTSPAANHAEAQQSKITADISSNEVSTSGTKSTDAEPPVSLVPLVSSLTSGAQAALVGFSDAETPVSIAPLVSSLTTGAQAALAGLSDAEPPVSSVPPVSSLTTGAQAALVGFSGAETPVSIVPLVSSLTTGAQAALVGFSDAETPVSIVPLVSSLTTGAQAALAGFSDAEPPVSSVPPVSSLTTGAQAALAGFSDAEPPVSSVPPVSSLITGAQASLVGHSGASTMIELSFLLSTYDELPASFSSAVNVIEKNEFVTDDELCQDESCGLPTVATVVTVLDSPEASIALTLAANTSSASNFTSTMYSDIEPPTIAIMTSTAINELSQTQNDTLFQTLDEVTAWVSTPDHSSTLPADGTTSQPSQAVTATSLPVPVSTDAYANESDSLFSTIIGVPQSTIFEDATVSSVHEELVVPELETDGDVWNRSGSFYDDAVTTASSTVADIVSTTSTNVEGGVSVSAALSSADVLLSSNEEDDAKLKRVMFSTIEATTSAAIAISGSPSDLTSESQEGTSENLVKLTPFANSQSLALVIRDLTSVVYRTSSDSIHDYDKGDKKSTTNQTNLQKNWPDPAISVTKPYDDNEDSRGEVETVTTTGSSSVVFRDIFSTRVSVAKLKKNSRPTVSYLQSSTTLIATGVEAQTLGLSTVDLQLIQRLPLEVPLPMDDHEHREPTAVFETSRADTWSTEAPITADRRDHVTSSGRLMQSILHNDETSKFWKGNEDTVTVLRSSLSTNDAKHTEGGLEAMSKSIPANDVIITSTLVAVAVVAVVIGVVIVCHHGIARRKLASNSSVAKRCPESVSAPRSTEAVLDDRISYSDIESSSSVGCINNGGTENSCGSHKPRHLNFTRMQFNFGGVDLMNEPLVGDSTRPTTTLLRCPRILRSLRRSTASIVGLVCCSNSATDEDWSYFDGFAKPYSTTGDYETVNDMMMRQSLV